MPGPRQATPEELAVLGGPNSTAGPSSNSTTRVRKATPEEAAKLHEGTEISTAPRPSTTEPSFFDRLGGIRGIAATGVRGLSGILGAEGGLSGAGIAGTGELAAEAIEGSPISAPRIATEAGLGAIPFSKIVTAGKPLASAARGAMLGGGGTVARELAQGQGPDLGAIGTGAAIGGATAGIGSKLMDFFATRPKPYEVVPTAQEGGQVLSGSKKVPVVPATKPAPITPTGEPLSFEGVPFPAGPDTRVPAYGSTTPAPYRSAAKAADRADLLAKAKAEKEAIQAANAGRIAEAREGLVPKPPKVSESYSAQIPGGGTERMTIPYGPPEEDAGLEQTLVNPREPLINPPDRAIPDPHSTGGPLAWSGDMVDLKDGSTVSKVEAATRGEVGTPHVASGSEEDIRAARDAAMARFAAQTAEPAEPAQSPLAKLLTPKKPRATKSGTERFDARVAKILDQTPPPASPTSTPLAAAEFENRAPVPEATVAEPMAPPPQEAQAPPSLMQILRTKVGATGKNYKAAKIAAEAGEIPTAAEARAAHLREQAALRGTPAPEVAPEAPSGPISATPEEIAAAEKAGRPMGPAADQAQAAEFQSFLDRLKRRGGSESGQISPALLKALGVTGSTIAGVPVGMAMNPDDPATGALEGALGGGTIGLIATGGLQKAIDLRNAGLLLGPAQLKKPLSDVGAYTGLAAEKALSGEGSTAGRMLQEGMRLPTNVRNYLKAFANPDIAREALGEVAPIQSTGALRQVARPFAAAQYATQQAMERAGVPTEEAARTLMIGDPRTGAAKWWLQGNKYPLVRAIRPFARIATNLAERGLERTPGVSLMMGDPETRVGRTLLGAGAMGLGGALGEMDTANEEAGTPTSPVIKGLRRALMASYGLPTVLGETVLGGSNPLEAWRMFPGLEQTMPRPASTDTATSYLNKFYKQWLEQELPALLTPDKGTAR